MKRPFVTEKKILPIGEKKNSPKRLMDTREETIWSLFPLGPPPDGGSPEVIVL